MMIQMTEAFPGTRKVLPRSSCCLENRRLSSSDAEKLEERWSLPDSGSAQCQWQAGPWDVPYLVRNSVIWFCAVV